MTHAYIPLWPGGLCAQCARSRAVHEEERLVSCARCSFVERALSTPEAERILEVHNRTAHAGEPWPPQETY